MHSTEQTLFLSDQLSKVREHFPNADHRAIEEYFSAQLAYSRSPTPATLDRLIAATQMLSLPVINLDQL